MTQNKFQQIQFQNTITERDRRAQDVADSRELVTPFTVSPGTPIYDVTIRPDQWSVGQVIVTLGLLGGTIEQRIMPDGAYTYQLAQAYAQNAHIKTIGGVEVL